MRQVDVHADVEVQRLLVMRQAALPPSALAPTARTIEFRHYSTTPSTTSLHTNQQVPRHHRQHAYLRRHFLRREDLPGQGAFRRPCLRAPIFATGSKFRNGTLSAWNTEMQRILGQLTGTCADGMFRASCMSVVTPRSSDSRMARPNLSSFSERTLEE